MTARSILVMFSGTEYTVAETSSQINDLIAKAAEKGEAFIRLEPPGSKHMLPVHLRHDMIEAIKTTARGRSQ